MAIDDIVKENLHVVETLAYKYAQQCPGMTADDFIGEGNMALVIDDRRRLHWRGKHGSRHCGP